MDARRQLLVIADDFGIGPETSRGILDLAQKGRVTGTVLLVNSPHAAEAVARWRSAGRPVDLGWHPNLTLDRPISPMRRVPSLVSGTGSFFPLGVFLLRLLCGQIRSEDLETELRAQWLRFLDLVGHPPTLVASHQHVAVFRPVEWILRGILADGPERVYLRTVAEPWQFWRTPAGYRLKRLVLNVLGRRWGNRAQSPGFATSEYLLGLSAGPSRREADFFTQWLLHSPGRRVELLCHPGRRDDTLRGRDAWQEVRPQELELLQGERFIEACQSAGWTLTRPAQVLGPQESGRAAA